MTMTDTDLHAQVEALRELAKLRASLMRPETHGQMWADLFIDELHARSAQHRVTGRALIFLDAGMEPSRVFDALKVDEAGWRARVESWEAWREENRLGAGTRLSAVSS